MSHATTTSPLRTIASYGLVALSPVVASVAWVATSPTDKASDARHVAWFATVALGCAMAGTLAPRGAARLAALATVAILATMTTLFLWWSSEDSSGLFLIGIIFAAPLVSASAIALLLIGRAVRRWRSPREPGTAG